VKKIKAKTDMALLSITNIDAKFSQMYSLLISEFKLQITFHKHKVFNNI